MLYNGDYVVEGMGEIVEQFQTDYQRATVDVDIDGSFGNPDILDLMDFLGDTANKQFCDKLVRQCIMGKTVTFSIDGVNVGSVRMNNLTDAWSVFPVINDYPATYKALADIVSVHLLKKSTLPRKKGTGPGAVATVGS
jgi:hypothetical protein